MAPPLVPGFRFPDQAWSQIAADAAPFTSAFGEPGARLDLERRIGEWNRRRAFTCNLASIAREYELVEQLADAMEANGRGAREKRRLAPLLDEAAMFRKALPMMLEEAMAKESPADKPAIRELLAALGAWWRDDLKRPVRASVGVDGVPRGPLIRVIMFASAAASLPLSANQAGRVREIMRTSPGDQAEGDIIGLLMENRSA